MLCPSKDSLAADWPAMSSSIISTTSHPWILYKRTRRTASNSLEWVNVFAAAVYCGIVWDGRYEVTLEVTVV